MGVPSDGSADALAFEGIPDFDLEVASGEDVDPNLYSDDRASDATTEYTVHVDCGETERKFLAFLDSLGTAVDYEWRDRHWK